MGYLVEDLVKFLCDQCKAKYQIADDKIAGKTVKMKCRKCGHQIEVRAAVTETSVASKAPEETARAASAAGAPASPGGPPRPGAPAKPAAPRVGSLATSLASAKPAAPRVGTPSQKPERPGALAGAFKSNVTHTQTRDEEISASFDLAELSAADEWYVAINGVPVGPIRIQEVRRKAALGAVTEDSLVWQEGLEEWRPVRAFTELASVVLEAATSGRTSLLTPAPSDARPSPSSPPGPVGGSNRPAPRTSVSPRGATAPGGSPAPAPVAPPRQNAMSPSPSAAAARSNVVPFTSRLATAERLDDATVPMTDELRVSVAPDPFASPPPYASGAAAGLTPGLGAGGAAVAAVPAEAPPAKRAPPWIAIAMIVLAAAFGITAALAIFLKAPQPVVIQMPSGVPQAPPPPSTGAVAAMPSDTSPLPQASGSNASSSGPGKNGGGAIALASGTKPTAAPSSTTPGFKVSGLDDTGPKVGGGGTAGAEAPKPGQCLTQVQVQSVIQQRQSGLKRTCWDKSSSTRATVNIGVMLTIGPGGEVQSVSANGEDSGVAHCVESDVRTWRFPAGGCVQQSGFAVHFIRQ